MTENNGKFVYNGNGNTLENGQTYTVFETDNGVEAYPEGESEPVEMRKATFASMQNGNLDSVENGTPMN